MSKRLGQAGPSNPSRFFRSNVYACFMPDEECENTIIEYINYAQKTILVQAYSFSSRPIAKALIDAKNRGTIVTLFIDKDAEKKEPQFDSRIEEQWNRN